MNKDEKLQLIYLYQEGKLTFEKDYFKTIMSLSTGVLAISITVLNFTLESVINYGLWLYFSWLFFGIAILFVLTYFLLGQYEYEERINDLKFSDNPIQSFDNEIHLISKAVVADFEGNWVKAKYLSKKDSIKRGYFRHLGKLSSCAFMFGLIFLGLFTYLNIQKNDKGIDGTIETLLEEIVPPTLGGENCDYKSGSDLSNEPNLITQEN